EEERAQGGGGRRRRAGRTRAPPRRMRGVGGGAEGRIRRPDDRPRHELALEAAPLATNVPPGRLAADAGRKLITEGGVFDEVVQTSIDGAEELHAKTRPVSDGRPHLRRGRQRRPADLD